MAISHHHKPLFLDENFDVNRGGFNLAHIYPEEKIATHLYDYVMAGNMNELL